MVDDQGRYPPGSRSLLRSGLKIPHLQLLVSLGNSRNLSRSAEHLSISQPAASRLLGEIERIVGGPVFDRLARGLTPNTLGEVLIRRARLAMAELQLASEEIQELQSGYGGVINIGAVTMPAVDLAIRAIRNLQALHPRLKITMEIGTSGPLVQGLIEGQYDFVFARTPSDVSAHLLDAKDVQTEEVIFVVNSTHPLLSKPVVELADVVEYPWALEPSGSLLRQRIDTEFRAANLLPPAQVISSASLLVTLAAVKQSDTISVVSLSVLGVLGEDGPFRRLNVQTSSMPLIFPAFALIRYKGRLLSPAAQALYDEMEVLCFGR